MFAIQWKHIDIIYIDGEETFCLHTTFPETTLFEI